MRITFTSMAVSTVLAIGLSGGAALAQQQSQPATGNSATSAAPNPSFDAANHHRANPGRQTKILAKKLGLSADQQAKIEPILADRQQQLQSLRADTTLAPQDRRSKAHSVMQESNAKINAVLTDEQKQQYEQLKQELRAKRMERMQQQGTAPSKS